MIFELYIPPPFWLILAGATLEYKFPYPAGFTHPVRLIGKLFEKFETWARKSPDLKLAGTVSVILIALLISLVIFALISAPLLGIFFGIWIAYSGLALGELLRSCAKAALNIQHGNIEQGRILTGYLVSRDTSQMQEDELYRAIAESLTENFNDGFVAPLFWLFCFGPLGLGLYKVISTADSMWGYTTEEFKDLGWFGARTDDLMAFIPARLCAFLLWISANFTQHKNWPGFKQIRWQAATMSSPNSGWPMSAAAWLHNLSMGGPTPYFGQIINKPRLGPENEQSWTFEAVSNLLRHIKRAGYAALILAVALRIIF